MKQFSCAIEEALFRLPAHRDRALTYKMEEVQVTVVDELYVEQNAEGHVDKQIARVRLFFLGFLSGKYHTAIANILRYIKKKKNHNRKIVFLQFRFFMKFNLLFRYARHRIRNK